MPLFLAWPPVSAAPQLAWEAHPAAEANGWQAVTWSPDLGLFVAVAFGGTNQVMTSPDGITWTARAAAEANQWWSVTWSSELDLFVAVAQSGTNRVMTSPDGITWTARAAAEANGWNSVVWSSDLDLFVATAISGTNRVMTSPDGITWTARSAPAESWWSVTWSPELDLFVSAAFGNNQVMTSPDGITWTGRTVPEPNFWTSVVWSAELNLFVAVAQGGTNRVMTSADGITWAVQATPEDNFWWSLTWSPELEKFVAVSSSGTNRVMVGIPTDNDGITDEVEDAAPNGGDANNDGTRDRFQSNVTSFVNAVTGEYVVLEADPACEINTATMTPETSNTVTDAGFKYPVGLMNFTMDCGTPGFVATVTQYYYNVTNDNFVPRKYNPNSGAYFAVSGAAINQTTIGSQIVTTASYQVTDGGDLDIDGTANGVIVDPVGLAQSVVGAPNTGLGGRLSN